MNRRDTIQYAKEEIIAAVDDYIRAIPDRSGDVALTLEEENEMKRQRDRVAKFLGIEQ